jgi:hypothetical protein
MMFKQQEPKKYKGFIIIYLRRMPVQAGLNPTQSGKTGLNGSIWRG